MLALPEAGGRSPRLDAADDRVHAVPFAVADAVGTEPSRRTVRKGRDIDRIRVSERGCSRSGIVVATPPEAILDAECIDSLSPSLP